MRGFLARQHESFLSNRPWLGAYCAERVRQIGRRSPKRVWVTIADHFEPSWRQPEPEVALERVRRWTRCWPAIAARHVDSAGRSPAYTFFYPEEQYDARVLDELAHMTDAGIADVEVHLHHDGDTESALVDRLGRFVECLYTRHDLLRKEDGAIRFGFIHGNWALDNSLPDGRFCGVNNEISILRALGCYADFTLPSAPSPAQTRMVNTIYWATDDPTMPKSHDWGVPVVAGGAVAGDLMMIPGPLTFNVREWGLPHVPKLECGELAGNCLPTLHRARLWLKVAPRIGSDVFIKLFSHGAPEKNAIPLLEEGALDRTLEYLKFETDAIGAQVFFVSAHQMWTAVDALRRGLEPREAIAARLDVPPMQAAYGS
jgi:hypothetical protein